MYDITNQGVIKLGYDAVRKLGFNVVLKLGYNAVLKLGYYANILIIKHIIPNNNKKTDI